jgi:hypothetical protein
MAATRIRADWFNWRELGGDLVTNGDFETNVAGWTPSAGSVNHSVSGGRKFMYLDHGGIVAGQQITVSQNIPIPSSLWGRKVQAACDLSISGGSAFSGKAYMLVYATPANISVAGGDAGYLQPGVWAHIEGVGSVVIPVGTLGLTVFLVHAADKGVDLPAGSTYASWDNVNVNVAS